MEKIIVIDDDSDFAPLLVTFVKGLDYEIVSLDDINTAIKYLMEIESPGDIKVIYCDHNLKSGTGLELMEFLDKYHYPVPFVPISASFEIKDTISYLNLGAAFILEKGFTKEAFLKSIEKIDALDKKYSFKYLSKKSILLVDDEPDILEVIQDALNSLPIKIYKSTNADDAIKIFEENEISLIVTDLKMAPKDGFYLSNYIWDQSPGFPIISATAFTGKFLESNMDSDKFVSVIKKPFQSIDLANQISKQLSKTK